MHGQCIPCPDSIISQIIEIQLLFLYFLPIAHLTVYVGAGNDCLALQRFHPHFRTGLADHNARKVILYRKVGADAVALQNNAAGIYLSIPLIGAVGISIPSRCFPTNLAVSVRIPACRLPGYAPLDSCLPVSIQHAFSTHNTSIFLFHCSPGLSRRMHTKK